MHHALDMLKNKHVRIGFAAVNLIVFLILFIPFTPWFVSQSLDGSWAFGINEAVAQGLVFGRDVIFTYGPYAAVSTWTFHPATDLSMLLGAILVALAFIGAALVLSGYRRWWLFPMLWLPLAQFKTDGFFLALPLLMVAIAARISLPRDHPSALPPTPTTLIALGVLVAALALLTLIKASFTLGVLLCGGCACVLLVYRAPRIAIAAVALFVVSLVFLWCMAGQPFWALPGYFAAQFPLLSNYGAMAAYGPLRDIVVYVAGAACLVAILFFSNKDVPTFPRVVLNVAVLGTFFLVFKASFVRHDVHAIVAAGAMLAMGVILALSLRQKSAIAVATVSLLVWAGIVSSSSPLIRIIPSAASFANRFVVAERGFRDRLTGGKNIRATHELLQESVRDTFPLVLQAGNADVYSYGQAMLIANGVRWNPRPVFQSYSAYSPALARMNAEHLESMSAPNHVYFQLQPIDGRFPSLEDGLSWLPLLTNYRYEAMESGYARFARNIEPARYALGEPILVQSAAWGQSVPIPTNEGPIWAAIDIRPTLLGRIRAFLFKPPLVTMSVVLSNGERRDYRFIPEMGTSGFLLSPLTDDTTRFLALLSPHQNSLLHNTRVLSVTFSAGSRDRWFWRDSIGVQLWRVAFPVQPTVDNSAPFSPLTAALAQQIREAPVGGECFFDLLNGQAPRDEANAVTDMLHLEGWSVISGREGVAPSEAYLVVAETSGTTYAARVDRLSRPDVDAYFGQPNMGLAGFSVTVDLSSFRGNIEMQLAQMHQGTWSVCPRTVRLSVHH